jgi:hypothetical protein
MLSARRAGYEQRLGLLERALGMNQLPTALGCPLMLLCSLAGGAPADERRTAPSRRV